MGLKIEFDETGLPETLREEYPWWGRLPDGRICCVHRLLYHYTLLVDVNEWGYEDRYCYATRERAIEGFLAWDGTGDPEGWHRHPKTGRRRTDGGVEWVAF